MHLDVQQVVRHGPDPQVHFLDVLFDLVVRGVGDKWVGVKGVGVKGVRIKRVGTRGSELCKISSGGPYSGLRGSAGGCETRSRSAGPLP